MRASQVSRQVSRFLTAALLLTVVSSAHAADDGAWTVSKSSGEVWFTNASAQPASLRQEEMLKPGDTIRTGRTGRVLLKRGEESMMISPNSVIGVPAEKKEGLSTTIVQQAGSILLEVEKRNVKHFEVETPYLAAVVKGTQFRVTVNATSTSVDVLRGQVEVADFRTGQIAQVKPGQHATTFSHGNAGLSLGGTGTLSPIEQGKPRTPSIERVPVPRAGLTAPRSAAIGQAVQSTGHGTSASLDKPSQRQAGVAHIKPGVIRISSSIGEVKLNVHKVTHGLARDKSSVNAGTRNVANKDTIWGSSGSTTTAVAASTSQSSPGNVATTSASTAATTSTTAAATGTTTIAAITATSSSNNGSNNNSSNNNSSDNNDNGNKKKGANGNGRGDDNGHGNRNANNDRHGNDNNGNGNHNGHGRGKN